MSNATDTRVTTGRVRFSYANLFHPRSVNGGPEKYSVTLLIPKADKKTMDKIRRAIAAATEQAKEKIKKFPLKPTNTVHDGDGLFLLLLLGHLRIKGQGCAHLAGIDLGHEGYAHLRHLHRGEGQQPQRRQQHQRLEAQRSSQQRGIETLDRAEDGVPVGL